MMVEMYRQGLPTTRSGSARASNPYLDRHAQTWRHPTRRVLFRMAQDHERTSPYCSSNLATEMIMNQHRARKTRARLRRQALAKTFVS